MKLIESILTKNPCYTAGRKIIVKGLMLHSVGCPQPSALVFVRNWNKASYDRACVHAFIDGNDGTVYQCLPWNHRGWHCGASGNNTHIGVEMCEPGCIRYTGGAAAPGGVSGTKIMGAAVATADQMKAYIKAKNPKVAQSVLDMVPLYLSEGAAEGVRGDIAFAQSCLETGNFGFAGSAVTLDQNNFCGMGVTSNGMKGNSFSTPQLGIRAQVQHLKAYASTEPLKGECIDPRFKYVTKGCAEVVEWLGQKENLQGKGWATGAGYGEKIIAILKAILTTAGGTAPTAVPFKVRVTATDLNIRTGPGTSCAKTGKFTGAGVFTITEVKDGPGSPKGWGRLKSGAGWIALDFAQKI